MPEKNAAPVWGLLSLLILLVYFFPLFPTLPWFSSKLAYIPLVCGFIAFVASKNIPYKTYSLGPFLFCLSMFVLHLWAELVDPAGGSYINSATSSIAKFFNFLVYYSYFCYFVRYSRSLRFLRSSLVFFVFVTSLYAVLELWFLDELSFFIHFFYERESNEILAQIGNSFFFTSYFAAHIYLFLFCMCLSFFVHLRESKWAILSILSLGLVFAAQSKTGLVSAVLAFSVIVFLGTKTRYSLIIIMIFLVTVVLTFSFLSLDNLYVIRSTKALVDGRSNSLAVRLDQIMIAFDEIKARSLVLGAGVGRGQYLESWVALYLYRYGVFGILVYVGFWCYLVWSAYVAYKKSIVLDRSQRAVALGAMSWFFIIPVISLSSSVWDVPKNGFFVFFALAAVNAIKVNAKSQVVFRDKSLASPPSLLV